MTKFDYGKYRGIIISIVLFLVLDASVLTLNFLMSFQIADDAVGVNVAGRQRMLSQRITKSLFDMQTSINNPAELERATKALQAATILFDRSFNAFNEGGVTPGPDGTPATIEKVSSQPSLDALSAAKVIWIPYHNSIQTLSLINPTLSIDTFSAQLATTLGIGRESNLALLREMNNLTVDQETVAKSKAETLRLIQTIGITLAILNFIIIMFHSVKQLLTGDKKIALAQNETREILDTVNEGLFLLDNEGVIGDQYSAELEQILDRKELGGQRLDNLLRKIVSEKDLNTTKKFIGLLFDPTKREKLLGSLNPLKEVEAHLVNTQGIYQSKFLSFSFSRVVLDSEIRHILVTVTDITKQVNLARELDLAQKEAEDQFEMLTALIGNHSDMLPTYLDNGQKTLTKINEILKTPARSPTQLQEKAMGIYTRIHGFKGESAAMDMTQFANMAHQFEDELDQLQKNPKLTGNDFLSMTVLLNKMMVQIESAQKLMTKISSVSIAPSHENIKPSQEIKISWSHLETLAQQVSERQNKPVDLTHSGLNDYHLPETLRSMLSNISVQLIRNSITHGIETTAERFESQKPAMGIIDIRLIKKMDGSLEYRFEDDGRGLDIDGIRSAAVKRGIVSEEESLKMGRKQIISLIFSPDLSTAPVLDQDAGRGIGMASIQDSIKQLNGRIAIASKRGLGCSFTVKLPASSISHSEEAA